MSEPNAKRSRRAVIVYSAVLFLVVVFFIGLSYFIDRRGDDAVDALHEQNTSATKKIEQLQTENVDMRAEIEALTAQLETLETEKSELENAYSEIEKNYDKMLADYNWLVTTMLLAAQEDTTEGN